MVSGMKTTVVGEANDYVGKGMAGGDIAIMPPTDSGFKAEDASIVGNTCLYGATGGRLFVNGKAGQFACLGCVALLFSAQQVGLPLLNGSRAWVGMGCAHTIFLSQSG